LQNFREDETGGQDREIYDDEGVEVEGIAVMLYWRPR